MPSLKEIKTRIQSVNSTRKITSAMKMVASSKLHHAQVMIENMFKHSLVREHIFNHHLCMVKFGRGNHLHGTRNLTGAVYAGYPGLYFF